jgi:hypothetical protein
MRSVTPISSRAGDARLPTASAVSLVRQGDCCSVRVVVTVVCDGGPIGAIGGGGVIGVTVVDSVVVVRVVSSWPPHAASTVVPPRTVVASNSRRPRFMVIMRHLRS